jgi:hypothetical protein
MAEKLPEAEKGQKITVKIIKPQSIVVQSIFLFDGSDGELYENRCRRVKSLGVGENWFFFIFVSNQLLFHS